MEACLAGREPTDREIQKQLDGISLTKLISMREAAEWSILKSCAKGAFEIVARLREQRLGDFAEEKAMFIEAMIDAVTHEHGSLDMLDSRRLTQRGYKRFDDNTVIDSMMKKFTPAAVLEAERLLLPIAARCMFKMLTGEKGLLPWHKARKRAAPSRNPS
jgi:hypothetical protein